MGGMNAQVKHLPGTAPQWDFSDRIRKVRRTLGLTQEQMAVALEVGDKRYAAWESGRNTPDDLPGMAVRLEAFTGVPRTWFLGWVDDSPIGGGSNGVTQPERRTLDYRGVVSYLNDYRKPKAA